MKASRLCTLTCAALPLLQTGALQAGDNPLGAHGPIDNADMKVTVDAAGIQAPGYRFVNQCAKPDPWQAKWIWPEDSAANASTVCFRKEITLDQAPRHVAAWMTGDTKYRVFINGQLVVRGPVDQGNDFAGGRTHRWFYDYRDLTPFFHKGKNVIAAEVFRHWGAGPAMSQGRPGLLFEADVSFAASNTLKVKSDPSWRAAAAAYYPDAKTLDLTKEPAGWLLPGFDDQTWSACAVQQDVWSPIIPSEMPPLMEGSYPVLRIEGLPANKTFTKDGQFRVIFDRVLSAHPSLKIKGGKGATVKITAHETMQATLADGVQYVEFPFMTEVAPSYTVELKNVTTPVEIVDAGAIFTSQPVAYRGRFECSDDQLNAIWNVSRWAVQICLQTHHLDSPNHQEPISDPGDYLIEAMVNHYAFAQPWLARQDIRKFAWLLKDERYRNFHISYSIGWLQMLMDYYDYTGDQTLIKEMAPYVHELMDTYATWRGANGILSEAPNYMFMDWVNIGGFEVHHPPAVIGQGYLTAFYYHGMEMASRVADLTGDQARVHKYAQLRQDIATAFNRELWVEAKGLYRDGKPFKTHVKPHQWLPEDKDIETFSPHVNLLAVLCDLAPRERQRGIVEKILADGKPNTQPWFMHWVFQAIDHAGLFEQLAAPQMRRWQIVDETQSFREMWNGGDLSHGWCSTPLVQMSSRVLGVTPASPGFATIAIRPALCDLQWARDVVPTPKGDVKVSWQRTERAWELDVTIPAGIEADVGVPAIGPGTIATTVDGTTSSDPAKIRIGPGDHRIQATAPRMGGKP